MSKTLFAGLILALAWVGVHANAAVTAAYPEVAWTCSFQPTSAEQTQDPAINRGLPFSEILQINLGPEEVISHGTMSCISPVMPTPVLYKNVVAISRMFTIGANVGLRPSVLQSSLEVNAGVSALPQNMFKKYAVTLTGSGNILLARIGAGGGLQASEGSLAGTGHLNYSPASFSAGGDVQIGTVELINASARAKRHSRK